MHLHCDVSWTGRVEGNVSRRSTQVNGVPLLLVELLLEAKAGELEKMAKKVVLHPDFRRMVSFIDLYPIIRKQTCTPLVL